MVIGTDVADLLLDGHEPSSTSYIPPSMAPGRLTSVDDAPPLEGASQDAGIGGRGGGGAERSLVQRQNPATDTVELDITDRFRHLLLHGRKKVGNTRQSTLYLIFT